MLRDALREAIHRLSVVGVASPDVDARQIAAHLLGIAPLAVPLHGEDPVPRGFAALIERRIARQPLQYILGTAPFGPLDLAVGEGVFIPRPETELLADDAARFLCSEPGTPLAVDLCTGSGAIAFYLKNACSRARVIAVEKEEPALAWARKNAELLKLPVEIVAGDVTTEAAVIPWRARAKVVTCNPPYVPESSLVDPEVYADPHEAVFGGSDGMALIPRILLTAASLLAPGGRLYLEHDETTAEAVRNAARTVPELDNARTVSDLAGRPRFLYAQRR